MIIRCKCGNQSHLIPVDGGYLLGEPKWYDKEEGVIRCPKCKNEDLPLELPSEPKSASEIFVNLVPGKTIAKR